MLKHTTEEIKRAAHNVRKRVLRLVLDHKGGYLGQTCSGAELLTTLYMRVMHLGESLGNPDGEPYAGPPGPDNKDYKTGGLYNGPVSPEFDRFIPSLPHYATALYCTLIECGRLSTKALEHYNKDGWKMEQIAAENSPGYESMTGSLGQAISFAGGVAHARKIKGEKGRVICVITDGESEEGQIWEAIQTAVAFGLDNLIVYLDANGQQCEGETKAIMELTPEDYANRFKAFGAVTVTVDGHDIDAIASAADTPHPGKPLCIVCSTSCTKDMPVLERKRPNLHHVAFSGDEVAEAEAFYAQM